MSSVRDGDTAAPRAGVALGAAGSDRGTPRERGSPLTPNTAPAPENHGIHRSASQLGHGRAVPCCVSCPRPTPLLAALLPLLLWDELLGMLERFLEEPRADAASV